MVRVSLSFEFSGVFLPPRISLTTTIEGLRVKVPTSLIIKSVSLTSLTQ